MVETTNLYINTWMEGCYSSALTKFEPLKLTSPDALTQRAAAKLVVCQEIPERNYPWQENSRTENVRFVDTFAGFCV